MKQQQIEFAVAIIGLCGGIKSIVVHSGVTHVFDIIVVDDERVIIGTSVENGTVQLLWVAPIARYEMGDKVTE